MTSRPKAANRDSGPSKYLFSMKHYFAKIPFGEYVFVWRHRPKYLVIRYLKCCWWSFCSSDASLIYFWTTLLGCTWGYTFGVHLWVTLVGYTCAVHLWLKSGAADLGTVLALFMKRFFITYGTVMLKLPQLASARILTKSYFVTPKRWKTEG